MRQNAPVQYSTNFVNTKDFQNKNKNQNEIDLIKLDTLRFQILTIKLFSYSKILQLLSVQTIYVIGTSSRCCNGLLFRWSTGD